MLYASNGSDAVNTLYSFPKRDLKVCSTIASSSKQRTFTIVLVVLMGEFELFIVEVFRLCLTRRVLFRFRFSGFFFGSVGIMGDSGLLILEVRDGF